MTGRSEARQASKLQTNAERALSLVGALCFGLIALVALVFIPQLEKFNDSPQPTSNVSNVCRLILVAVAAVATIATLAYAVVPRKLTRRLAIITSLAVLAAFCLLVAGLAAT